MKKVIFFIFTIIIFVFALCYQSILIDKSVSDIPFTPNIFVSASNAKKVSTLYDGHSKHYLRKLNDSLNIYYEISETLSNNDRVTGIIWEIKYENMNPENLLNYLDDYDLFLFTKLSSNENLYKHKTMFINNKIRQNLVGSFNKKDNSYLLIYDFPKTYVPYKDRSTFKTSLKDFLIGAPH